MKGHLHSMQQKPFDIDSAIFRVITDRDYPGLTPNDLRIIWFHKDTFNSIDRLCAEGLACLIDGAVCPTPLASQLREQAGESSLPFEEWLKRYRDRLT